MSKALRYLSKTRPQAATNLMGFYKHSVVALDEKTRFLIQIVTKITVGTERGLRQYAPKALKAGATKEEILDAAMMAFPAAGLNKLLDAIDILNDLDLLPEVEEDSSNQKQVSKNLGALDQFPVGRMQSVKRPDGDLIVYRATADQIAVYDARCPHSKANLCDGTDHGDRVECKVHNWTFDLESGNCIEPRIDGKEQDLIKVAVAVVDGNVILQG
ncbi:MAG: Rieske 2Fe-2S domain-containing protein [Magnetococcales bacterium]|nr:Rieske 2Fe-2S domain-containing protein [Magnetococcales bacterium]